MKFPRRPRLIDAALVLLAIALICGGITIKRRMLDRILPQPGEELMYFPSGKFLRQASFGHQSTLADIVWLRVIQYYGYHRLTDKKYDMIGHIFDIITTLDPQFIQAYVFGSVVLSQDAGRPQAGLALLRKGMRNNPDNWLLVFETGFIYYTVLRDYGSAGRYFSLSSRLPNAPEFTSRFAAFVEERAGHTETALQLWEEVARGTSNKYIQEIAEERIQELKAKLKKEGVTKGRLRERT